MGKTTTEMQLIPVSKLIPYVNNARTHSAEQILKLRASLREFGFINPVIIDREFNVIAGHGRISAAKEEGILEVPCVFVDYLTEAQKKAYILADNRMAMDAGWDEELLRIEIESLQGEDFDIGLTGFDESEIADLFGTDDAEEDDFDVEEELKNPCFSKQGDVWKLGKHTVICGDSTDSDTFKTLLEDKKVNLVCTDAPYFVNLENQSGKIANDNLDDKSAYEFLMKVFTNFKEYMASLQDTIESITIQPRTSKTKPKGLFYGSEGDGKSKSTDTEGIVGDDGGDPTTRNLGGTRHRSKRDTHKGRATAGGHDTVHKRYGGDINQELKNVRVIKTSRNTYRVSFILPRDIRKGHVEIVTVGENGKSNRLAIHSASELMGCTGIKRSSEGVSFSSMKGNEKVQFEFALLDNRDYAMEVNVYEHN